MNFLLKTSLLTAGLAWFLFSGCTTIAPGHDHHHHTGIRVYDAWVRAVPPNMNMTAAYMSLHNHSDMEDALVSAETPVAGVVETHTVEENNGVMSMKPVDSIPVPANGMQELKPGGYHLMLIQLKEVPKKGETVSLVLNFKHAGRLEVDAKVNDMPVKNMEHHDHGKSMDHKHSHQ